MDYIAQFITDIRHVRRPDNPVADALLGIATLTPVQSIDFLAIVSSQHTDEDLMCYLNDPDSSLLTLQDHPLPTSNGTITCDVSTSKPRPFMPQGFRRAIFNSLHNLSHPGVKATQSLITE